MGLIKALTGAGGGTLADQWKEFIYCDALDTDTLMTKGQKRVNSDRSSNTKANDNIISNGSRVAVNNGQAMIIVEQGKVVEFCAEPGEFTWDKSTEPSIFYGGLGNGILDSFKKVGERLGFGGDTGKDQRVYFFNLKEIMGNKYGTTTPVPFRVVDANVGLDLDISVRCNGEYSYQIVDPLLFYTNVCGNAAESYTRDQIDSQLKTELLSALQPAFARISELGIRYSAVPAHTTEVCDALNQELSAKWTELRGLKIVSFGVNSISASEEDQERIKAMQTAGALRTPGMQDAYLASSMGEAMKTAAANENGAMNGFMGMGMVGALNNNAGGLLQGTNNQPYQQQGNAYNVAAGGGFAPAQAPAPAAEPAAAAPAADSWTCSCGTANTGKFCAECGSPKPEPAPAPGAWTCSCGTENTGKFCAECGSPKPAEPEAPAEPPAPAVCGKCGWAPEDPANPPKFCPECGNPFA